MMKRRLFCLAICGWSIELFTQSRAFAQAKTIVAAASDLKFALDRIVEAYKKETGQSIDVVYGASGNLAQQIFHGAPFHVFLSADEQYIFHLAEEGKVIDKGQYYATGRLAFFVPNDSPLSLDEELKSIGRLIYEGRLHRFAIANPAYAPYGRAAKETLTRLGLWEKIQPFLVYGENAAQAMQFTASGSVQGGLVPLSLAKADAFKGKGMFIVIPVHLHGALKQRMALTKNADSAALAFYHYLLRPDVDAILKDFGFDAP